MWSHLKESKECLGLKKMCYKSGHRLIRYLKIKLTFIFHQMSQIFTNIYKYCHKNQIKGTVLMQYSIQVRQHIVDMTITITITITNSYYSFDLSKKQNFLELNVCK